MKPTILVVDDEVIIRESLQAYFEDEGMQVTAVASAEEALDRIDSRGCCAVCIMDIRLSGMDGNVAIGALHNRCPGMAFIVYTGTANYSLPMELQAIGLGAEQVYLKPLDDMGRLAAAVYKLVRGG